MADELKSYPIRNMIQGVSQQTARQRRDTQCEEQFDCVNSPINGAEARPPVEVVSVIKNAQQQDAFQYEIFRGDDEHYQVVVSNVPDASGHRLRVFNWDTGLPCLVKYTDSDDYLATALGPPKDKLVATTLEDVTFLGNRETTMLMDKVNLSPAKDNDAIIYFKAGGYSVTFKCVIHIGINSTFAVTMDSGTGLLAAPKHGMYPGQQLSLTTTGALYTGLAVATNYYVKDVPDDGHFSLSATPGGAAIVLSGTQSGTHNAVAVGVSYAYTYLTPDNSTSGNAAYISTNQLAAIFYKGFTGANPPTGGGTGGVQAAATPLGAASAVSGTLLTDIGFSVFINGSCLKISQPNNISYTVDCTDGVGDTYMRAVKDTVKSFSDLPSGCFTGFTTRVIGTNKSTNDDYYVRYSGPDGISGSWQEVVAPGTPLSPDAATMPMSLINTAYDTFELKRTTWGKRISGDGIYTSLDPSFIGKTLQDLSYDNGRFAIMTEGSSVWARARNPYVFFKDTAQTALDTDPIDLVIGGGKRIAILRRFIQINEATFLWAQKLQFRVSSGTNPFKYDTVESKLSTAYEFTPVAVPFVIGTSMYFAAEPGPYATIRDLSVDVNGRAQGAVDVTAHVKKYIPSGLRIITGSDTGGQLFLVSDKEPSKLWAYNFLLTSTDRIQSAWNIWRLPTNCTVLWAGLSKNYLFLMLQRDDGVIMAKINLSVDQLDPEDGAEYLTRVDLRTTEYDCGLSYDPATDTTTITPPYELADVAGWSDPDLSNTDTCPMFVANRITTDANLVAAGVAPSLSYRGYSWGILSITPTTIVVKGDATWDGLYVGYRISAEREETEFNLKDQFGVIATHSLTAKTFEVTFAETGYFRAKVTKGNAVEYTQMSGRRFGSPTNIIGKHSIISGKLAVQINANNDAFKIRLINDSFLPSRWATAKYDYVASFLAKPTPGQGAAGNQ